MTSQQLPATVTRTILLPVLKPLPPQTWEEMQMVKGLFWGDDETVIQFHPKKSAYVNCHPFCLHLWKQVGVDHQLPPGALVGPQQVEA